MNKSRCAARAAIWLCALLISGCATAPKTAVSVAPAELDAFALNGRVNVRVERGAYPGRIRWQHASANDEVWLYSPIGAAVAHLRQTPGNALLVTSDGKEHRARDLTGLAQELLGYDLPLDSLQYWVRGLPAPSLKLIDEQRDAEGRPQSIQQTGWKVVYLDWTPAGVAGLPSKMDVIGDNMRMRLVVDEWKIDGR